MTAGADLSLDSKYRVESGRIFLSGIQALVRLPVDQHRADRRRGLRTATVISGYPGSPLGGFDLNLQRNAALLAEHNIRFIPGLNEELGATVVFGGQLAGEFPRPRYDGVLGMWYGKAPGVDRTGENYAPYRELPLGENVRVVGTVNIDETTLMPASAAARYRGPACS